MSKSCRKPEGTDMLEGETIFGIVKFEVIGWPALDKLESLCADAMSDVLTMGSCEALL